MLWQLPTETWRWCSCAWLLLWCSSTCRHPQASAPETQGDDEAHQSTRNMQENPNMFQTRTEMHLLVSACPFHVLVPFSSSHYKTCNNPNKSPYISECLKTILIYGNTNSWNVTISPWKQKSNSLILSTVSLIAGYFAQVQQCCRVAAEKVFSKQSRWS